MDKKIGQTVKECREKAGLSQIQIAHFLDIDQSSVSKCEKGEREFSVEALEKLASLFGCSQSQMLQGNCLTTIHVAFRSSGIESSDLEAIANVNQIALNLVMLKELLRGS